MPVDPIASATSAAETSARTAVAEVENEAPTPLESLASRRGELELQSLGHDVSNKKLYAKALLIGMGVQIALADGVFVYYAIDNHWHIPTAAISTWLGATVVQVIAVVLVVAHYLFPNRDGSSG